MMGFDRLKRLNWRLIGLALSAVGVLNITATLIAPVVATAPAVTRLASILPANKMQILPPVTAKAQPLPFMGPDAQYAMCSFDSRAGTVAISASLPEPGWTLALYSAEGDNFYTAVAQAGRIMQISLRLIPADDRFQGLTPEAKGQAERQTTSLTLVARNGIAVLRAPDMGPSYRARTVAALAEAKCGIKAD